MGTPGAAGNADRVFVSAKRTVLHKLASAYDLSPKGSIDAPVRGLVQHLNALPAYVTLSSCSGRVAVFETWDDDGGRDVGNDGSSGASAPDADEGDTRAGAPRASSAKGRGGWLYVTHGDEGVIGAPALAAAFADALAAARPGSSIVVKTEPLILHVQCRTLTDARALLRVAVGAGFRESGISIGGGDDDRGSAAGGGKLVVAVRSTTPCLEAPLRHRGADVVAADAAGARAAALRLLATVAAERMADIAARRARFIDAVAAAFPAPCAPPESVGGAVHAPESGGAPQPGRVCNRCGTTFASRNKVFAHLLAAGACAPSNGRGDALARVLDAATAASAATASAAVPTAAGPSKRAAVNGAAAAPLVVATAAVAAAGTEREAPRDAPLPDAPVAAAANSTTVTCDSCGAAFPTRNRLFSHLRAPGAAGCRARLRQPVGNAASAHRGSSAAVATPVATAAGAAGDSGSAAAPSTPTAADVAAAAAAAAASRRLMSRLAVAAPTQSHFGSSVESAFTVSWRVPQSSLASTTPHGGGGGGGEAGAAVAPLLQRWGHTAVLLTSPTPPGADAADALHGHVVAFGGYCGGGVHGRSSTVALFDTRRGVWGAGEPVVGAAAADVPSPRYRHAACAVPAADGRGDAMLVCGGHNGPLRPLGDAWWLTLERGDGDCASADAPPRVLWTHAPATASAPPGGVAVWRPRWGHSLTAVRSGDGAGGRSTAAVILHGGRDSDTVFGDTWLGVATPPPSAAGADLPNSEVLDGAAPVPSPAVRWAQLEAAGAPPPCVWSHAAVALRGGDGGDATAHWSRLLVVGGFASTTPPHVHGAHGDGGGGHAGVATATAAACVLSVRWSLPSSGDGLGVTVEAAHWSRVRTRGVPPSPRASHVAVSLAAVCAGAAADSVLVFGGHTRGDPTWERDGGGRGGEPGAGAELWTLTCDGTPTAYAGVALDAYASVRAVSGGHGGNVDATAYGGRFAFDGAPRDAGDGGASRAADGASTAGSRRSAPAFNSNSALLLPLPVRAAAVLIGARAGAAARVDGRAESVANAAAAPATARVLLCGGGAVTFAFGAHFSATAVADVDAAALMPPRSGQSVAGLPPLPAAAAAGGAHTSRGSDDCGGDSGGGSDGNGIGGDGGIASDGGAWALVVPAGEAEAARRGVDAAGWLDAARRCAPVAARDSASARRVGVPLTAAGAAALRTLAAAPSAGVECALGSSATPAALGERVRAGAFYVSATDVLPPFHPRHGDPGTGGPRALSRLAAALSAFLEAEAEAEPRGPAAALGAAGRAALAAPGGAPGGAPRRTEWLGPRFLLLPPGSMTHAAWGAPPPPPPPPSDVAADVIVTAPVWDVVAAALGADRVARAAPVDPGRTRASHVTLLRTVYRAGCWRLPDPPSSAESPAGTAAAPPPPPPPLPSHLRRPLRPGAPPPPDLASGGWTLVTEGGGVRYAFDATRNMFSSGNVTEKARMGALDARGETVVDLFAGIGYYTLPLLVRAGAAAVHACDVNPDAVATLALNLALNGVPAARCTLWPGDNAALLSAAGGGAAAVVAGSAHRVLLGLLPSSEAAWPVAIACLRPGGGVLHVHGTAPSDAAGVTAWAAGVAAAVRGLAAAAGRDWDVAVRHVERVKSYAPRVLHVVADVECRARVHPGHAVGLGRPARGT